MKMTNLNKYFGNIKWQQIITIIIIVVVIVFVGIVYYNDITKAAKENKIEELKSISNIKEQQISEWVKERFDEQNYFSKKPNAREAIEKFNKGLDNSTYTDVINSLHWLQTRREYLNIMLFNEKGELIVTTSEKQYLFSNPEIQTEVKHHIYSKKQDISVIWVPELNEYILQFYTTITQPSDNNFYGLLVCQISTNERFAQHATSWPTTTKSAEISITKIVGDSIITLTKLANLPQDKYRCLGTQNDSLLPSILTTKKEPGYIEGIDFRGNKVMCYTKILNVGNWILSAKIDTNEFKASLNRDYLGIYILTITASLAMLLIIVVVTMLRERKNLQTSLNKEKKFIETMNIFKLTIQNLGEAIIAVDVNNKIILINPTACSMLGYSPIECVNMNLKSIFNPIVTGDDEEHTLLTNRYNAEYYISLTETPNNDNLGNNHGKIIMFHDISNSVIQNDLLKESYNLHVSMFENNPQPMLIYEIDSSRIIQMNHAAVVFFGYNQDEIKKFTVLKLIHEQEFERFRNLKYAINQGTWNFITRNNKTVTVEISGHSIKRNNMICRHIMINDVTERMKAQKELKKSELQYRTLINILPDALLLHKNKIITFVNEGTVKLFKAHNAEEIIGKPLLDFFPSNECRNIILGEEHLNNTSPLVEHTIDCLDGSTVDVESIATVFENDNEIISQIIIHDISQRKKAQQDLIASEERYRNLFEITPEAIFIHKQFIIQYANQAAATLLGFESTNDLKGLSLLNFFLNEEAESLHQRNKLISQPGVHVPFIERKMRNTNGDVFDAESIGAYLSHENEDVSNLVIVHDISKRKKMEAEIIVALHKAEESDRLKSSFLANFSHEIRTPLNAIVGFADMVIQFKDIDAESRNEYLNIIQKSSFRLLSVINDTIEISKIDSGAISIFYSPINISEFMNDLFNLHSVLIYKNKGISFELIPPDNNDLTIISDKNKLTQILSNLINNSIKYTNEGGIMLSAHISNGYINFILKDTGIGIEPENLELIFKRFHRIENPTTTIEGGIGLGLSIAQAYARLLKGDITVKSRIGIGSEFTLTIPYIKPSSDLPKAIDSDLISSQIHVNKADFEILIAEDDDSNFRLLHDLIFPITHNIVRAKNGKESVDYMRLSGNKVGLILMDIKMPIMDGYEAFKTIREFNKDVPIVAQTAHALAEEGLKIKTLGFNALITKPITRETLIATIDKFFTSSNNFNK